MKTTLMQAALASLLLLGTTNLSAQTWQWGKRGGSTNPAVNGCCLETAADMATDKNGNIYVLGSANMGIDVDGHSHPGYGNNLSSGNVIISSWDCNGGFRWMKVIGSYTSSAGKALRTDTLGGVYVCGYTLSNNTLGYTHFDSDSALGNTNKSLFIVKYDTAGKYQWLQMPQPDTVGAAAISYNGIIDMDVAPNGDVFALCYLDPGVYSTYTVTATGFYVMRHNASGGFVSATKLGIATAGGTGGGGNLYNMQTSRFKRDHRSGRYYIGGHFDDTWGSLSFGSTNIKGALFLGGFSNTGASLWTRESSTTSVGYEKAGTISGRPAVDEQGNVYVTGNTFHGQTFNGHVFTNKLTTMEWPCPFAMKVDQDGFKLWAVNGSVVGASNGMAITVVNNEVALAGNVFQWMQWEYSTLFNAPGDDPYVFLARLNPETGLLFAIDTVRGSGSGATPTRIERDRKGNYYLCGQMFEDITVRGKTLSNVGGESDWFVAKSGVASCSCPAPVAAFSVVASSGFALTFSYTGTTPVDSVTWDFGTGERGSGLTASKAYGKDDSFTVCATAYSSCGIHTYCRTVHSGGLGFAEQASGNALLSCFPNPANDIFHINGLQTSTPYTLYNSIGSKVQSGTLNGTQATLQLSGLAGGWYIVELLHSSGDKQRIKVVKQ